MFKLREKEEYKSLNFLYVIYYCIEQLLASQIKNHLARIMRYFKFKIRSKKVTLTFYLGSNTLNYLVARISRNILVLGFPKNIH